MNAQEAIEIVEGMQSGLAIKGASEYIKESFDPEVKEMYEERIEATSIVLELAKRLEKIKDEALLYSGIEDLDVTNVQLFVFSKWVYDVSEGADE